MAKIRLYHFTSSYHLPSILKNGLRVGDVPLHPLEEGENAVWLTTNPNSNHQGWICGSVVDKSEYRITVEITVPSVNLKKWSVYAAQKRMNRKWYDVLDAVGGGRSDEWWLYFGVIAPEKFIEIVRRPEHEEMDERKVV